MRRFRFGLEKLLELRAYAEREAEMALARAVGEKVAIEKRIEALAQERAETAAYRFSAGRSAAEMRNAELYLIRLERTKEALLEAAARAELAVEAARAAFDEARRERKVLDRLKDKKLAEHRKERLAEDVRVADEISSGAPARRAASGGSGSDAV